MNWWHPGMDARELAKKETEVWSPVEEGRLYASNLGTLYNPKTSRTVGAIGSEGYLVYRGKQVHRLISAAFDGPLSLSILVHHKDHQRTNNRLDNLERVDRATHAKDEAYSGERRHRSGVAAPLPDDAAEWVRRVAAGEVSQREALRALGRSPAWLHFAVSRHRAAPLPAFPPLTPDERASALQAAQRSEEIYWRPAPVDPEYEVSNLGRVRSRLTGKIRKFDGGRYPRFRSMGVHQAVMMLYGPPAPFPDALVRHYPDPTPSNCSIANLRWGDAQDNAEDSIVQGLLPRKVDPSAPYPARPGRGRYHSHLHEGKVSEGLTLTVQNRWTSGQLAEFLGVSQPTASQILNGRTWLHVPRPPELDAIRRKRAPRKGDSSLARYLWDQVEAVRAGTRRYADEDVIVTRDDLLRTPENVRDREVAPALFCLLREHVARWGWFYPATSTEPLADVLASIRAQRPPVDRLTQRRNAGMDYLKSRFFSYWDVDGGPVRAFESDTRLRYAIQYRLGLSKSKPYRYTLRDGSTVQTRETFDITLGEIRRGFVVQRSAVSFFRPTVAASIWYAGLHGQKTPTVWDPSGGFGGRLLGFAAMFPEGLYYANEPAKRIRDDLTRLAEDTPNCAFIEPEGSEKARFGKHTLDMVFTSPPYFDLEKYYDEPGQCWKDYPTLDLWTEKYLLPTLETARHALRPSAPCVLNVDEASRDVVTRTAERAGLRLEREFTLVVGRDVLNHRPTRTEPVLIFRPV